MNKSANQMMGYGGNAAMPITPMMPTKKPAMPMKPPQRGPMQMTMPASIGMQLPGMMSPGMPSLRKMADTIRQMKADKERVYPSLFSSNMLGAAILARALSR